MECAKGEGSTPERGRNRVVTGGLVELVNEVARSTYIERQPNQHTICRLAVDLV